MIRPSITAPGGIRQTFPVHHKPGKERREWDNRATKGLTYLTMERGYQRSPEAWPAGEGPCWLGQPGPALAEYVVAWASLQAMQDSPGHTDRSRRSRLKPRSPGL